MLSVLLSMGNGILLARLFDPSERGQIAQYLYIASLASSAALMLFVPQAITKTIIASGLRNSMKPLAAIMGTQGALSVAVASIYVILVARSPIEASAWALIGVFASINVLYHGFSAMHRGLGNVNLVSSTQPAALFCINGLLLAGLVIHFTVLSILCIYVITFMAVVVLLLFRLGHKEGKSEVIGPFRITRNEAFGLSSVEIVLFVYGFSDRFLLSEFFSLHAFGLYAVASSVAGVLFVLQAALTPILFMQLARESTISDSQGVYISAVEKLRYFHLSLFAAAVVLAIAGYVMIPLLFGKMYAEASVIVPFLVFGYYCRSLSTMLDTGIRAAGHARVSTAIYIAGFAVFGCLSFGMQAFTIVEIHLVIPAAIAAAMASEFLLFCIYYRTHTAYTFSTLMLIDKERGILAIKKLVVQSRMLLHRK